MEKSVSINISVQLNPNELQYSFLEILNSRYNSKIFKNYYIIEVISIKDIKGGKILNDGKILYTANCNCNVLYPCINENYTLEITNINKMGALHKNELVTVFVPTQYYNGIDPVVGQKFEINIMGVRVEDSIVCVAQFKQ